MTTAVNGGEFTIRGKRVGYIGEKKERLLSREKGKKGPRNLGGLLKSETPPRKLISFLGR